MSEKKLISIVTPCFNEEAGIRDCYQSIKNLFETTLSQYDFEHIFTDNASTDQTVSILKGIAQEDARVKIIVNARNFGPNRSNYNALRYAKGDAVIVLFASDLQDPPEVIPQFVEKWEEGFEVVYGARKKREKVENPLVAFGRYIYYRIVKNISTIAIPPDVGEFQLIDKKVHYWLMKNEDYFPYIRGMIANCGFKAVGIEYDWQPRKKGKAKTKLFDLIDQSFNGIISFSHLPLRICIFFGFVLAALSITYAFMEVLVSIFFFRKFAEPGIPTLIVAIFFFSGIQLFFLGILGEYISAIHFQVRKRPLVIERERFNLEDKDYAREPFSRP